MLSELSTLFVVYVLASWEFSIAWLLVFMVQVFRYNHYKQEASEFRSKHELTFFDHEIYDRPEKVVWLNTLTSKIWLQLERFMSQELLRSLGSILETNTPDMVKGVFFEDCSVGKSVPLLNDLTIIDRKSEDIYCLELDLVFEPTDLQIKISLNLQIVGWLSVMVSRPRLNGKLQIEVELMPKSSYIKRVDIAFLEKPDFNIEIVPLKAVNVMNLPMISTWIRDTILNAIAKHLVLPNKVSIDMDKPKDPNAKKEPQLKLSNAPPHATTAVLQVHLVEGRNLIAADMTGKSDPYVVFRLGSTTLTSKYISQTLNPTWNETFELLVENPRLQPLYCTVYDKDIMGSDDFLGSCTLKIDQLQHEVPIDRWLELEDVESGQIHLQVKMIFFKFEEEHPDDMQYIEKCLQRGANPLDTLQPNGALPIEASSSSSSPSTSSSSSTVPK